MPNIFGGGGHGGHRLAAAGGAVVNKLGWDTIVMFLLRRQQVGDGHHGRLGAGSVSNLAGLRSVFLC